MRNVPAGTYTNSMPMPLVISATHGSRPPPHKCSARLSTARAASLHRLRQRRVGVAGAGDVLGAAAELHHR